MKNFKKTEQDRQTKLIQSKNPVFYGDKGGGVFGRRKDRKTGEIRDMAYEFVLQKRENNLFEGIRNCATQYFKENGIKWWSGKGDKPTGHILSSQVACINHLFAIRNDKDTVLAVLNKITKKSFTEVLEINCDEKPAYISFEVVSKDDHLFEGTSTRGSNCTSIDAFILAKQNDETWLIPIEWKYTEHYGNTDKSTEKRRDKTGKISDAGKERLSRYANLISESAQLNKKEKDYTSSVYFFEPFYQLMRQTLWAEQMIEHNKTETLKAVKFVHIHVIPENNLTLLEKTYKSGKMSGKMMEETWRDCLKNQSKYLIINPFEIANIIKETNKYNSLAEYLSQRYYK